MEVSVFHSNIKKIGVTMKSSSIVREVRSDETYLGGIYGKLLNLYVGTLCWI